MKPTDRTQRVLWYLCYYGLGQEPSAMGPSELAVQHGLVRELLKDQANVPTSVLLEAIQYGMPHIFPISENGYFDGRDLIRYLHKAKAVAAKLAAAGRIPTTPEAVESTLQRMAEEDEWND